VDFCWLNKWGRSKQEDVKVSRVDVSRRDHRLTSVPIPMLNPKQILQKLTTQTVFVIDK